MRQRSGHRADASYLSLRQFGVNVRFASHPGAVDEHVGHIVGMRLPRNVRLIHASKMSIAALMRRLVPASRGRPVNATAYQPMDEFFSHPSISVSVPIKRPYKTVVSIIRHNDIGKERVYGANGSSAGERIAVAIPSSIMRSTQATCAAWFAAIADRAYKLSDHSYLSERLAWLWRVVGLDPDGAPIVCTNKSWNFK